MDALTLKILCIKTDILVILIDVEAIAKGGGGQNPPPPTPLLFHLSVL